MTGRQLFFAGVRSRAVRRPLMIAGLIWLTLAFLAATVPFLADYPPVAGDDAWIMSVSHRLATTGRLGTELFTGFFQADQVYFLNLPLHHVWQAILFRLLGPSVWSARLVALLSAVLLLWLVSGLAFRWYGPGVALVTAGLLLFWRSGLTGSGIPLLLVGRSGRYDASAVLWVWLAIWWLDRLGRRPSAAIALALGVSSGLAALTQFYGALALPLATFGWLVYWRRGRVPGRTGLWLAGGAALVLLPYGVYVWRHLDAFRGQQLLLAGRTALAEPVFYGRNLAQEWRRLAAWPGLPAAPAAGYHALSGWLLTLGIWPALGYLARRWWRRRRTADGLLLATVVLFWAGLALLEATKAPLYAVILAPSFCLLLAVGAAGLQRWARRRPRGGRVVLGCLALAGLLVLVEGGGTYLVNGWRARQATPYAAVGQRLQQSIPPGAVVAGFEQWWWALYPKNPLRSWTGLWQQWQAQPAAVADPTLWSQLLAASGARFLIISRVDPLYLQAYSPALQAQFWDFLAGCTRPVDRWRDATYGEIQVVEIRPASRAGPACP